MPSAIQAGTTIRSARVGLRCALHAAVSTKGENNSEQAWLWYLSCPRSRRLLLASEGVRPVRLSLTTRGRLSRGLQTSALPNQTNSATSSSRRRLLANAVTWRFSSRDEGLSAEAIHNSRGGRDGGDCEVFRNGTLLQKNNSAYLAYHHVFTLNMYDLINDLKKRMLEALMRYDAVFSGGCVYECTASSLPSSFSNIYCLLCEILVF